mgnify:CR=1 FL=1
MSTAPVHLKLKVLGTPDVIKSRTTIFREAEHSPSCAVIRMFGSYKNILVEGVCNSHRYNTGAGLWRPLRRRTLRRCAACSSWRSKVTGRRPCWSRATIEVYVSGLWASLAGGLRRPRQGAGCSSHGRCARIRLLSCAPCSRSC